VACRHQPESTSSVPPMETASRDDGPGLGRLPRSWLGGRSGSRSSAYAQLVAADRPFVASRFMVPPGAISHSRASQGSQREECHESHPTSHRHRPSSSRCRLARRPARARPVPPTPTAKTCYFVRNNLPCPCREPAGSGRRPRRARDRRGTRERDRDDGRWRSPGRPQATPRASSRSADHRTGG
jgi:hypothetical protein